MSNIKYLAKEIALSTVDINGLELEHVSDELKDDKEVVFAAVRQDGYSFKYASLVINPCFSNF